MRYDTPVYFQYVEPGKYDEMTGDYEKDTVAEVKKFACVTDSGLETVRLLYGELKQGSLVIRLQRPYVVPFNRIRIGEKLYTADMAKLRRRVFVVSEVQ